MVPNVSGRPAPVRLNRIFGIVPDADRVRCTAGVGSRPYSVPVVHCYTADLIPLIQACGLLPYLYADDTQIYGFC